jgi:lambda family phage portal protein
MTATAPQKFTGLLDQYGQPLKIGRPKSTYDAAADTPRNQSHWANADGLSAKAANSREVRRKLRNRARLEFDNGGNVKGTVETIGHDLIGTGPRLQLTLPKGAPKGFAKIIQQKYWDWCDDKAVNFTDKLRIGVESETRDGESFFLFTNNDAVAGPLKFDVRVVETDQITTPAFNPMDPAAVDGMEHDAAGNIVAFHLLKYHPGDLVFNPMAGFTRVPASQCLQWFRPNRAGHARGIPRITPGLPLMAQIRGWVSATLAAARLGAHYAGFITSNLPPVDGPADVDEYDHVPAEDGGVMTLPAGWDFKQISPEHPAATHRDFKETTLSEFGRCVHAPRNVVTGDSSGYNFSSARLDFLIYRGAIRIERNRLAVIVLDPTFKEWANEAILTPGYLPDNVRAWCLANPVETWSWKWQYDGFPSINPVDDATADETNLKNGLVTHGDLLAERGVDWREHFDKLAEQRDYAQQLGIEDLLYPWVIKPTPTAVPPPGLNRTNEGTKGKPQQFADDDREFIEKLKERFGAGNFWIRYAREFQEDTHAVNGGVK